MLNCIVSGCRLSIGVYSGYNGMVFQQHTAAENAIVSSSFVGGKRNALSPGTEVQQEESRAGY